MTVLFAVTFTSFFLEYDNFVAFQEGNSYFTHYFCSFYSGSTYFHIAVSVKKQYAVKFHSVAFFFVIAEVMNIQELSGFSLELLSLDFYNCVHY